MNSTVLIWVILILLPVSLFIGMVVGYFYKQNQVEKEQIRLKVKAEQTIDDAKEKARLVEIQARDQTVCKKDAKNLTIASNGSKKGKQT